MAGYIIRLLDWIYKPIARFVPVPAELFRYAVCGGANVLLDWFLYFLVYNFVVGHDLVHVWFLTLTPHVATLFIVYPVTLATGFYLAKYVTFTHSNIQSHVQAVRYVMVSVANLMINYFGLKLFVEVFGMWPTVAKIGVTLLATAFSFFGQKYFTFVRQQIRPIIGPENDDDEEDMDYRYEDLFRF